MSEIPFLETAVLTLELRTAVQGRNLCSEESIPSSYGTLTFRSGRTG